ncbi:hypothetical protein Pen01_68100 [Phytomonospora endophytica]|nr:hypothetical protein Pen01_68100 [Phytomonospora endophytica]
MPVWLFFWLVTFGGWVVVGHLGFAVAIHVVEFRSARLARPAGVGELVGAR